MTAEPPPRLQLRVIRITSPATGRRAAKETEIPMRPPMLAAVLLASTLLTGTLLTLAAPAVADEPLRLVIRDHRFEPPRLEVPAGVAFKLIVQNADTTAEEFDSSDLHREKVVPAGKEVPLSIGPLTKGEYKFVGEYHEDTAKGVLVAK